MTEAQFELMLGAFRDEAALGKLRGISYRWGWPGWPGWAWLALRDVPFW